jgi:hypothetical protein
MAPPQESLAKIRGQGRRESGCSAPFMKNRLAGEK